MLEFDALSSDVPILPDPPAPPQAAFAGETDPADYIPEGMSGEDREKMRRAADMVSGALSNPFIGLARPNLQRASTNMAHFRNGQGSDLVLTAEEVEDLALSSQDTNDYETSLLGTWLSRINEDFQGRGVPFQQYISRNANPDSANFGTPWIGFPSAIGGSGTNWFFAIGSFWMCYTVLAAYQGPQVVVTYRRHIFDRYNWHNDLNVDLPEVVGNAVPPEIMETLSGTVSAGQDDLPIMYMGEVGDEPRLFVDDSLFGSMIEADEAAPYNVTGSGTISQVYFERRAE